MRIGLIHPGEMGAAFGRVLTTRGHEVLWVPEGRSADTMERARRAELQEVGTLAELSERAELVLSICPPHVAVDVARSLSDFDGIYVDANAVAPATTLEIEGIVRHLIDGSIIGSPPLDGPTASLYLSGAGAEQVADLFSGSNVKASVISDRIGAASALKMAYAGWTKGSAALLLAVKAAAAAAEVDAQLLAEWESSQPHLLRQLARAERSAGDKGWRWVGEMEEIAGFFASVDEPDGFHRAAAEVYRRFPRP